MLESIRVALADDHSLLRHGLAQLVNQFPGYQVVLEVDNGQQLLEKLRSVPSDVILLDLNMPTMDGFETAIELKKLYPDLKILALSMFDDDESIFRIIRNGAKGYVVKDVPPATLKQALDALVANGYAYSDHISGKMMRVMANLSADDGIIKSLLNLSEREIEFLKLSCTDLTYKEVAEKMLVSPRTIDGYRDTLFEKLHVKSRVGLARYAIKNGIFRL